MDWIPEPLRAIGPCGVAWWQWMALVASCLFSLGAGRIGAAIFGLIGRRLSQRTSTTVDDELLAKLLGPARLLGALAFLRLVVPLLQLPPAPLSFALDVLLAVLAATLVWGALRTIDLLAGHLGSASWARSRPSSRALLSLLSRTAKLIIIVIAVIGFLGGIGLPVGSLLAGLGIGGIAIAFGAQKTVSDLFGAFALGIDQPLREGDFVKIESDVLGTVESVGLRSTRVRTLDRTLVTLPNGRVADMRIETFAARDRCRFATTIGLVYDTSAAQMREVLAGFERVLREHPRIWPDTVNVRFASFGASSLDIEIMAWFQTGDWGQFLICRQEVLLAFMDIVETAGSSFAFPTHTVHLVQQPGR
ncbi:MAG: mechanosensitive ion channel family protein [Acidobacteriota bacterium]